MGVKLIISAYKITHSDTRNVQIATAMVAGTFFSLPISVVSSKMISLSSANPADYISLLDSFLIRIAIVGLVCTVGRYKNGQLINQ
jgi:hypothetical protein